MKYQRTDSKTAIIKAYHDMGLKWCISCSQFLSEMEFHKANHQKYGYKSICKKCDSIESLIYYHKKENKKKIRIYNAKYNQRPDVIERRKIRVAKNRKKINARALALRHIPITLGQRCEECRKELATERHHKDYDKPLEVDFLCKCCHEEIEGFK